MPSDSVPSLFGGSCAKNPMVIRKDVPVRGVPICLAPLLPKGLLGMQFVRIMKTGFFVTFQCMQAIGNSKRIVARVPLL